MTMTSYQQRGFVGALSSRFLHKVFQLTRGLTVGVRAIVRTDDGRFLLVRHTYMPGWHFPGGGVETRETMISALDRELRQETGLKLVEQPVLHGVFHNRSVSIRDHILAYRCEVRGASTARAPSLEIAEIGYFGPGDLPDDTDPGTERRIREIADGRSPGDLW